MYVNVKRCSSRTSDVIWTLAVCMENGLAAKRLRKRGLGVKALSHILKIMCQYPYPKVKIKNIPISLNKMGEYLVSRNTLNKPHLCKARNKTEQPKTNSVTRKTMWLWPQHVAFHGYGVWNCLIKVKPSSIITWYCNYFSMVRCLSVPGRELDHSTVCWRNVSCDFEWG